MNKHFSEDEIIFLLGAGASKDAGVMLSSDMIDKIEELIEDKDEWVVQKDLYHFIKSAWLYKNGIHGNYDQSLFNIETLVSTIEELEQRDKHNLYPFIGSWVPKLINVIGDDFSRISKLKSLILAELVYHWVALEDRGKALSYYPGLLKFQRIYGYSLKVFSLNYDMCVEEACNFDEIKCERGFNDKKVWDWRLLEEEQQGERILYLYKLHGSIDWYRTKNGDLLYKDGAYDAEKAEIIFGKSYKLQYTDPFLYLTHEFRKQTLSKEDKLIVCIGYSFNDEHINGILKQSLQQNGRRLLLSVSPDKDTESHKDYIATQLNLVDAKNSIFHEISTAKEFINNLSNFNFGKLYPEPSDTLF